MSCRNIPTPFSIHYRVEFCLGHHRVVETCPFIDSFVHDEAELDWESESLDSHPCCWAPSIIQSHHQSVLSAHCVPIALTVLEIKCYPIIGLLSRF